MDCPHTSNEQHSVADENTDNMNSFNCHICHGRVKYCQNCSKIIRASAIYCTNCGEKLKQEQTVWGKLLPPGTIREAIESLPKYPLDACLGTNQGENNVVCWFGTEEGCLIITRKTSSASLPVDIFFIPGYDFQPKSAKKLALSSGNFPSYLDWVQEPILSVQGLFIITSDAMLYFNSQGRQNIYEGNCWEACEGEEILAMKETENGHPAILLKTAEHKLAILMGNTQTGKWGGKQYYIYDINASSEGYMFIENFPEDKGFLIFSGNILWRLDKGSNNVIEQIDLDISIFNIPTKFTEKIKNRCFSPFIIRPDGTQLKCVIPFKQKSEGLNIGVLSLDSTNSNVTAVNSITNQNWISPDIDNQGFFVGNLNGVYRFQTASSTEWASESGNVNQLIYMTPNWIVTQVENNSAQVQSNNSKVELWFFEVSKVNNQIKISERTTAKIPNNVEGIGGMSPLYWEGDLFIALRDVQNKTIDVYFTQIVQG